MQNSQDNSQVSNSPFAGKEGKGKINEQERKFHVKGITLKQYFQLCKDQQLNEISEQSIQSSKSSLIETPKFNHENMITRQEGRIKIKTEISESDNQNIFQHNLKFPIELQTSNRNNQAKNFQKYQKEHASKDHCFNKKDERKKVYTKMQSQSTKHQIQLFNRSTLNTFYQLQENKKKMLKKIQADKQKINDLSLKEALSITKYGSRFNIQTKLT